MSSYIIIQLVILEYLNTVNMYLNLRMLKL